MGKTSTMQTQGFFAYPDASPLIGDAIHGAVELSKPKGLKLKPWQTMRIYGFKVDDVVRAEIRDAAVLVADITYPNANVYYEIGYAIALGKPVVPTVHSGIEKAVQRIQTTGLFDTIGWVTYANAQELHTKLMDWPEQAWASSYIRPKNHVQPLFILDTQIKTDFRNHIMHAVENSKVEFRSFDPAEVPRLTAAQAVSEVSSSSGVIIPFVNTELYDAVRHNLRASFLLGLCHGYEVEALAIQYENAPVGLDYRDYITNSTYRHETEKHVSEFAAEVLIWNQKGGRVKPAENRSILYKLDLGSPTAENETQKLPEYFVETAEYARALRAEGAVIIGRKGSGKSAIYLRVAETLSRDKRRCVVDLRPASHNLSEMRESMLSVVTAGVFQHTIAAFWQYIMYMEILLKLREVVLPKSKNNFELQDRIRKVEEEFHLDESVVSGDFTSRLEAAVSTVIKTVRNSGSQADVKSKLTNMMFEKPIPRLRDAIVSFADFAEEIIVLIDDLDKGWPPLQVESHDVSMLKHLIEILNRLQRDLGKRHVKMRHALFMRSDIYEQLVSETSDRGKYNVIKIDWSDGEQLRHLIYQRVVYNITPEEDAAAWAAINPTLTSGDAMGTMIEGSLRRPRFLIDLCERTVSVAVNRGHEKVEQPDLEEGLRQMSLYLVSDFGYEMRDIAGTPEDIFYEFIGTPETLSDAAVRAILAKIELKTSIDETIDLLMWYGFLGVKSANGEPVFIYDRAYDFRRLEAERAKLGADKIYAVNPAFLRGLND